MKKTTLIAIILIAMGSPPSGIKGMYNKRSDVCSLA
jgi:hypothetical protein